ncbi:hypothetical protein HK405_000239, partial [Cladochytrium tenue]
ADGPLAMSAAMDTYRVNRYNITGPGFITSRLIQGGFRYQKLNLSSAGDLVLRKVGVRPTTDTTPIDELAGRFNCSDEVLNSIWRVGARTIQLSSIPAHSIPKFWRVSSEGALVESQAPQVLSGVKAAQLTFYSVMFDVKPLRSGFGVMVLADTLNSGIYIVCNIANGSISAYHGQTDVNVTPIAFSKLAETGSIKLGSWVSVTVDVAMTDITVTINGVTILEFSQTVSFYGSFGFGASLGHAAIFRNLSAVTMTGESIYTAALKDELFFDDFLMGDNLYDTIVDGSKRDRISYSGDLDIAMGAALVSTNGTSFIQGTLNLLGSMQITPGFFSPTAKIQQAPSTSTIDFNTTGLIGYSFHLLTAAAQFYQATGNIDFALEWAPRSVKMLDWANSQVLVDTGLFTLDDSTLGGDWNYYDDNQSGVVTKFNTLYAYALQECIPLLRDGGVDTAPYESRLAALRRAIQNHLWSDALGAYVFSATVAEGFAQDANSLAILSGLSPVSSTARIFAALDQLATPYGPVPFSPAVGNANIISPFASAFHLRAAFEADRPDAALALLKSLWAPMADPSRTNHSGCFWEAISAESGAPGLGDLTSLCHAWAAGPTAALSRYVLGVHPAVPGYVEWRVAPQTLGLQFAEGRVPVPGGALDVAWEAAGDGSFYLSVEAPAGTNGTVVLPDVAFTLQEAVTRYRIKDMLIATVDQGIADVSLTHPTLNSR